MSRKRATALRKHDCTAELSTLGNIRTLVLSAAEDPIAPPRFGRQLAALISGARFIEMAGASHGAPIQHATTVNRYLAENFRQR